MFIFLLVLLNKYYFTYLRLYIKKKVEFILYNIIILVYLFYYLENISLHQ